ncbi:unnamed protein product [Didymodactylos carnosus]|uniref:Uncharacterized protein n=1 Tax=Didymodactylos carnosus TaxID=1234261 RepID=A0A814W3U0_9BILA|nr:unnamed protein product [Didymodactylos carnosus]CAF3957932.1 unnamed protein product [Didymodactylos carnosus]
MLSCTLAGLPLLALCCLGLLGFIFAGVIVIALIPVFLQRHNINTQQRESSIIQILYNLPAFDSSLIANGQVPQSRYRLQQQLDNATSGSRRQHTQVEVVNVVVRQPQNIEKKRKRRAPSQTVEGLIQYFYGTKAVNYSETLAQMIVQFRLSLSIDCFTLICQNGLVQRVTTQIFIVIRFDEISYMTFFGLTPSSGGSSSNNNSTTLQILTTSAVSNQPQQLSSTSSGGNGSSSNNNSTTPQILTTSTVNNQPQQLSSTSSGGNGSSSNNNSTTLQILTTSTVSNRPQQLSSTSSGGNGSSSNNNSTTPQILTTSTINNQPQQLSSTSSGGNGSSSNNNSTTPQILTTSTISNRPQQLSSTSSKAADVSFTQIVSNPPSFSLKTISRSHEPSVETQTPEKSTIRSSRITTSQMTSLFSVFISTIAPKTTGVNPRQPTSFSSEKTPAFTKERLQTPKTGTDTTLFQITGRTKLSPVTKSKTSKRPKPTKPSKTKPTSPVQSFTSLFTSKTSSASGATSNQPQIEPFTSSTSGT